MKSANTQSTTNLSGFPDQRLRGKLLRVHTDKPPSAPTNRMYSSRVLSAAPKSSRVDVQQIPLRTYQRYLESSFLANNHEVVLKQLNTVSRDVINHLQINRYQTQQVEQNCECESKLLFKMYETLIDLDKEVVQQLFCKKIQSVDQIGVELQKNVNIFDNFRFDILPKTLSIMDDLVVTLVKDMKDRPTAVFIEQLWKFWVVVLDLNTQWTQNRYDAYLNIQIAGIQKQLQESEQKLKELQDKYHEKIKGTKLMLAMERKGIRTLKSDYAKLLDKYHDSQQKLEDLNNIEYAQGDLNLMNRKLKEMDKDITVFNRTLVEERMAASKSIHNIGTLFKKQVDNSYTGIQLAYRKLKIIQNDTTDSMTINPLVLLIDQINDGHAASPLAFLEYLQQNIKSHPMTSLPELFNYWCNGEQNRINLLRNLIGKSEDEQLEIVRLLIGIGQQYPTSYKVVGEVLSVFEKVEQPPMVFTRSPSLRKKPSLKFNEDHDKIALNFTQDVTLQSIEQAVGQDIYQQLLDKYQENKTYPLYQLLLSILRINREQELDNWNMACQQWSIDSDRWYDTVLFQGIDGQLVQIYINQLRQLVMIQYYNKMPQDKLMQHNYLIWLMRPRVYFRVPSMDVLHMSPNSKRSDTRKSITLKRK